MHTQVHTLVHTHTGTCTHTEVHTHALLVLLSARQAPSRVFWVQTEIFAEAAWPARIGLSGVASQPVVTLLEGL